MQRIGDGARGAIAALMIALAPAPAWSEPAAAQIRHSHGGTTTWHLDQPLLDAIGLHVGGVTQALPRHEAPKRSSYRNLEFAALDLSEWRFREAKGLARGFTGGALRHAGGFVLEFGSGRADLRNFELRPNARAAFALDVADADGNVWFTLDRGHYQLEDGNRTFALRYMNLRLSAQLARAMQRPQFAGLAVGGVDTLSPLSADDVASIGAKSCTAPWPGQGGAPADIRMVYQSADAESGEPDDIHFMRCGMPDGQGGYTDVQCTATSTDRGVVFAPDTSLLNAGTTTVSWHRMFSGAFPPYGNDQHPFLVWNLYRVNADGSLQQLAASGAKHAFNTINVNCGCSDHANSYPACEDSYSLYSNDISNETPPNFLGPRSEIVPAIGQWGRCFSVFDKDCDGAQDADAGAQNDFQYRLIVTESDISPTAQPGAAFYFEYWYVVRDQTNIYDAMGHRPVSFSKVAGDSGNYLWNPVAGPFANGPVVNLWVDPAQSPAGALNSELATPEGRARIAVRTTALGGGLYRYDYVVMNFDFARGVIDPAHASEPNVHVLSADGFSAFAVPISADVIASDFAFSDADTDGGNDWSVTQASGMLRWQAPPGHPLNWGTLYRFSFTANVAPLPASAQLDVATAGTPAGYAGATLAPLDDSIFHDGFGEP